MATDGSALVSKGGVLLPRYTYGQPVPGAAIVEVCRGLRRYYVGINEPNNPLAGITEPCHKQTKQVGKGGGGIRAWRWWSDGTFCPRVPHTDQPGRLRHPHVPDVPLHQAGQ